MATDIQKLLSNLKRFYDFSGKTIISVGAGGGQLIEYGRTAKQVYAVDNDLAAIEILKDRLELDQDLKQKFTVLHTDFYDIDIHADVVFYEFSLHEMSNPKTAIRKALQLAPQVVIADHGPYSEWTWLIGEEDKVACVWTAYLKPCITKLQVYEATQQFADFEELYNKVKTQGEATINRIEKYRYATNISIPMQYVFALIN